MVSILALVFGLSAVPRTLFSVELRAQSPTYEAPEGGDSIFFDRVASGDVAPPRAYFHSPLYRHFLGLIYRVFGRDLLVVRLLQHLLGALTAALVSLLAFRLFRRPWVAFCAGLAQGWFGPAVFYEGQLLVDALTPLLTVVAALAVVSWVRRPRPLGAWLCGLSIGVAALGRPTILLWSVVAIGWLVVSRPRARSGSRQVAALLAGVVLAVLPVTLRNLVVAHEVVPISSNAGLNLYIGNNPNANGAYNLPDGLWFEPGNPADDFAGEGLVAARKALDRVPTSSEVSRWWAGKALSYMAAEPGRTAFLVLRKIRLLVNDYEYPQLYNYYAYRDVARALRFLLTAGFIVAPGLLGLALAVARGRESEVRLYAVCVLTFAVAYLPFFVVGRYRAPWVALLAPLAAWALAAIVDSIRRGSWRRLGKLIVGLCVCAAASFTPLDARPSPAPQYHAFGVASLDQGRIDPAIGWMRRAVAADPYYAPAQAGLGVALLRAGHPDEARLALLDALEFQPENGTVYRLLGVAQRRVGRPEEALRSLRNAVELAPGDASSWWELGRLLESLGHTAEAEQAYGSALTLGQADPSGR
jgi:4-amino-4-deoxy-L-arabinose transferase-like glycosyltransferase